MYILKNACFFVKWAMKKKHMEVVGLGTEWFHPLVNGEIRLETNHL